MTPDRFQEQYEQIQRAMPGTPIAMGPGGAPQFLYEKGHVLALEEDAPLVEEAVRERFRAGGTGRESQVRITGRGGRGRVTRIQVGDPAGGGPRSDPDVSEALLALREREERAERRLVGRNHIVTIAVNACPADEPVPVPQGHPPNPAVSTAEHPPAGAQVSVLVVDTGLVHDYHQHWWAAGRVTGDMRKDETGRVVTGDLKGPRTDEEGVLRQYAGHGTFITGLLAAVAPRTRITVRNTLEHAGAIDELEFGERLLESVEEGWPDIISLSAGTPVGDDDTFVGLEPFLSALRDEPRTLLVAAAGNNGTNDRFWPAACATQPAYRDRVLSVGALRSDGTTGACFSNHGNWVRVYAPGERLISSFTGTEQPVPYDYQHSTFDECRYGFDYLCTCQSPAHTGELSEEHSPVPGAADRVLFHGMAQWSGTSFATPLVAAMVADYMTAHPGTTPRQAAAELLESHTERVMFWGRHVSALRPPGWQAGPTGEAGAGT